MTIGQYINNYLQEEGISQRQFARECGLSSGTVSMLVTGKNPNSDKPKVPTLTTLIAIASGMGITVDELLSAVDDMPVDVSEKKNPPAPSKGRTEKMIRLFGKLSDDQQEMIIAQIRGILSSQ